jgi:hypothetical protein
MKFGTIHGEITAVVNTPSGPYLLFVLRSGGEREEREKREREREYNTASPLDWRVCPGGNFCVWSAA